MLNMAAAAAGDFGLPKYGLRRWPMGPVNAAKSLSRKPASEVSRGPLAASSSRMPRTPFGPSSSRTQPALPSCLGGSNATFSRRHWSARAPKRCW
ncbi:hypothetical protein DIPPA_14869 [Diplonema papillatum]|nr:hypothetical protein DIPPA_14869 [Diplonema papillatum]